MSSQTLSESLMISSKIQNTQLLWEQIDFNFTVGRCFVSDKNYVYYIPTRRKTMSDGDVKVCLSYDSD